MSGAVGVRRREEDATNHCSPENPSRRAHAVTYSASSNRKGTPAGKEKEKTPFPPKPPPRRAHAVTYSASSNRKGTPAERRGRKATGLPPQGHDSRAAEVGRHARPIAFRTGKESARCRHAPC